MPYLAPAVLLLRQVFFVFFLSCCSHVVSSLSFHPQRPVRNISLFSLQHFIAYLYPQSVVMRVIIIILWLQPPPTFNEHILYTIHITLIISLNFYCYPINAVIPIWQIRKLRLGSGILAQVCLMAEQIAVTTKGLYYLYSRYLPGLCPPRYTVITLRTEYVPGGNDLQVSTPRRHLEVPHLEGIIV